MKNVLNFAQVFALATTAFAAMVSAASAWGCKAKYNGDDAYGYSHSYNSREDAENRALRECNSRTSSGSCHIVECDSSKLIQTDRRIE